VRKCSAIAAVIVLIACSAFAKDKKQRLPEEVLRANTVLVVNDSPGVNLSNPSENSDARASVERALRDWGRFRVEMFYQSSLTAPDLIIAVRPGGRHKQVIRRGDEDDPMGGIRRSPGDINVGVKVGRTPPMSSGSQMPGLNSEVGPEEDTFAVYLAGSRETPLDAPAIWRYSGKNILTGPVSRAVQEFRKVVEESEKARSGNTSRP
jgi:hypothetical protein